MIGTCLIHISFDLTSPKTKDSLFDNFVVTGGTVSCRHGNLRCRHWRQSCQNGELLFSGFPHIPVDISITQRTEPSSHLRRYLHQTENLTFQSSPEISIAQRTEPSNHLRRYPHHTENWTFQLSQKMSPSHRELNLAALPKLAFSPLVPSHWDKSM